MALAEVKQRIGAEVDRRAGLLVEISRSIHARPELGYEERYAHDALTAALEGEGLALRRHAFDMETAFVAHAGDSGPRVAVLCEYDALPGIGHACGHNIIAAAGLGAGLAAAALAEELGGRLTILGTPAEEGGAGKVHLLDAGAFDGVEAALMVHPAGRDLRRMDAIANQQLLATYHGRSAHAAAAPHEGRNALDAAVLGYNNVAALRQHIRPDERIHGVFRDGGARPNVVPAHASTHWYLRAGTLEGVQALMPRVQACLEGGALAAGCEVELDWLERAYAEMRDNQPLLDLYAANARVVGREPAEPTAETAVVGSTDMGNVSYVVPSIHPMIAVSPPEVSIHTEEFAAFTGAEAGDRAVLDGAKAMAMTIADLWSRPETLEAVRGAFERPIPAR